MKANTVLSESGLRNSVSQFSGFLLKMLIPELTPDFSRVGPENQDFYHIPHVILHSGNFEDSWTLNWNGGQEVGKKEKESRENSYYWEKEKSDEVICWTLYPNLEVLSWAHFKEVTKLPLKNASAPAKKQQP